MSFTKLTSDDSVGLILSSDDSVFWILSFAVQCCLPASGLFVLLCRFTSVREYSIGNVKETKARF